MWRFNLKALVLMLLLVLLLFSNFDTCSARRGRHRRSGRDGNSSSGEKKNNGRKNNHHHHHHHHHRHRHHHHHHSGSADSSPCSSSSSGKKHKPSPAPNPYLSPCPIPSPSPKPEPKPQPSPSTKHKPKPGPSTKHKHKPKLKPRPSPCPTPSPKPGPKSKPQPSPSHPPTPRGDNFSVLDLGAEGDGKSDDTKAFQATWAAACKVKASTILVPSDFKFLVGPISFNGAHCQNNIVFQLDGTIIAPTNRKAWGSGLLQWLEFTKLEGFTIQGSGTIDGQGAVWWGNSQSEYEVISRNHAGKMPHTKPTAVRFYGSHDATVTGITIQNSPKCHLKFDNCNSVEVYNIIVSSPGSSPNTDGIHLQNSRNVAIHHNQLGCGDDCVSLQTGCSNINIHHVNCGPGHGFSIGGLGKHNTKACVSNVTVKNVALQGTMTGVRIKTWQGGSGSVQNVRFSNIEVSEVKTPIMINQYYCDRSSCKNQTKAIALSGIYYENIKGTYTAKPVHLACSDSSPCTDIILTNIELTPVKEKHHLYDPYCWQSYGQLHPPMVPPMDCLQTGKPPKDKVQIVPDSC